ncbi:MAG TPA: dolichyl-phosphate beta-glucosyltransferase [Terriglobales bacterium]|nr:dolichyl-phosphate beta-glucosyltransferase [Terriglobales bacterium]
MPTYSIIIPAYNEERRLGAALEQLLAYAAAQGWDAEVLVVNDGSRDRTAALAAEYAARHPVVRLLENPGNRGKGYSVRHGMLEAKGDLRLFTDADLSAPIAEAEKLFAALAAGAEIAIGSRWLASETQTLRQPLYRQFFGRLFNLLLRLLLGLRFQDTQCGFKAFTRRAALELFSRLRIERWAFDPELLYLARRRGLKVEEVPVAWAHDRRSTISPLRDGPRMFWDLLRIRWYALTGKYSAAAEGIR